MKNKQGYNQAAKRVRQEHKYVSLVSIIQAFAVVWLTIIKAKPYMSGIIYIASVVIQCPEIEQLLYTLCCVLWPELSFGMLLYELSKSVQCTLLNSLQCTCRWVWL